MLALSVETVLLTLFGYPFTKGTVTRVVLGNDAMPILLNYLMENCRFRKKC